MRILTVSNCQPIASDGSGQIIRSYTEGLRALGHTVDFMGPDDYEILQLLRPRANSYRQAVGMWLSSRRKLHEHDYELIEFYGGEAFLAMDRLARRADRRFLLVQHTNGPEPRYEEMLDEYVGSNRHTWYHIRREPFMKRAFTKADLVVTVSQYDREWLVEKGFQPSERVVAIDNPIADEFFEAPASQAKEKLIGYCGTWLPKKGIHVIAEDVGRILKEFPDYRLLLIGVGPTFEKQHWFSAEVCSKIDAVPYVENKIELRNLYSRMSIFVLPSVIESFGLALAEAMACGCAAVATKLGFAAGLADREDAMLLEEAESPKLYHAVRELILNADLRYQLSQRAPRAVQHLRWSDAISKLNATYMNLASLHLTANSSFNG